MSEEKKLKVPDPLSLVKILNPVEKSNPTEKSPFSLPNLPKLPDPLEFLKNIDGIFKQADDFNRAITAELNKKNLFDINFDLFNPTENLEKKIQKPLAESREDVTKLLNEFKEDKDLEKMKAVMDYAMQNEKCGFCKSMLSSAFMEASYGNFPIANEFIDVVISYYSGEEAVTPWKKKLEENVKKKGGKSNV